jgi:hypothetical protein
MTQSPSVEIWVNKHSKKAGQVVDCRAQLLNQRPHSKLNCPTLLGEELTNSCSWRVTQLTAGEINSFDNSAWSGKSTSTHNLNLPGWQKNKTVPTSQSPSETISELLLVCQYQDWMLSLTPELKLRLKFYCFWTWCFVCLFVCFSCLFCLFWVFYFNFYSY